MPETLKLVVNGEPRSLEVEGRTLLVHALRDGLGLTGAHIGCDTSQCGACTVLLDLQCGFCTPGVILTAADLLSRESSPGDDAIRHALRGNLCRCTGYQGIVESVRAVGASS